MKKLTIIGRGTVGCIAVAHFVRWTDWEINWIYDPVIEPSAVGEGTTLVLPNSLAQNINFNSRDMDAINATPKLGIHKRGWGNGDEYYHSFPSGHTGMHFNAVQFQNYMFERLTQTRRVTKIEGNFTDYENLDSNFVMVCTGSPNELDDNYKIHNIPVNSCIVFQCPWELPRFNYTLTFAKEYGWVFGIPLKNRCSIGYLYNDEITKEQDVRISAVPILEEFNLEPSMSRKISFRNYSRKVNFSEKVCYNGNSSFFLEPLEATSTGMADKIIRWAFDLWNGAHHVHIANAKFQKEISQIEAMICLHYLAGSQYDTDFWSMAKQIGEFKIRHSLATDRDFFDMIYQVFQNHTSYWNSNIPDIGSWSLMSYVSNIEGLGLKDKLKSFLNL